MVAWVVQNIRQMLILLGSRSHLNLVEKPNNRWEKPRAPYYLTRAQKRDVMKWFMEIKFPDGYAANLRRGVNTEQLKIHGLKSHDYHIFMERLLPVMIRGFVNKDVWVALAELSYFYRMLCAKEIDPIQMLQLEQNIPIIICKVGETLPAEFLQFNGTSNDTPPISSKGRRTRKVSLDVYN